VVTKKELVLNDQSPAGIEQAHMVVGESRFEYLIENTERVVNAQRVGGLAEADSRDVKGRPPLNQHNLHAASREGRSSRQSAHTTSDD
jgi:hypothetical protein